MQIAAEFAASELKRRDIVSAPVYWTRDGNAPELSTPDVAALLGRGTPRRFQTLVTNVGALPPGHMLHDGKVVPLAPFPAAAPAPETAFPLDLLALRVRDAVRAAVRRLTEGNAGQLGLLLSGGLDSSILAYELVRLGVRPHCFVTNSHGPAGTKEHGYAARVCYELGLSLTRVEVTPADLDLAVEAMLDRHPRPLLCWVAASQFAIARAAAREGCIALAIGIGGDEIFGGYHKAGRFMQRFENARSTTRRTPWDGLIRGRDATTRRLLFIGQCCPFPRSALRKLLPDADLDCNLDEDIEALYREVYAAAPGCDGARVIMEVELGLRVPDILAAELTAATDAAGLTLHFPFLAEEVLAAARAVPARYKYAHDANGLRYPPATKACDKMILRAAFEDIVPAFVQLRRRATYTVPFHHWLGSEPALARRVRETVLESAVWDRVGASRGELCQLFKRPLGSNTWGMPFRIWTAYALALWWDSGGLQRWWRHSVAPDEIQVENAQ